MKEKSYQVIGHYLNIRKDHISSTTVSDGVLFRTKHDAERYAAEKMHPGATIKEREHEDPNFNIPEGFHARRAVKVCFVDPKHNYVTEINETKDDILRYFVGAQFNVGAYPKEEMLTCVSLEFLDFGC